MPQPILRLATASEIPALVRLRVLMQQEVHHSTQEPGPEFLGAATCYFEQTLKNGSYSSAVAESSGRLVGAAGMMRLLEEHARALGVYKLHLCATEAGQGVYERVGFRLGRYPYLELDL